MTPEQKSRWRRLALGFLLPAFLIWALYYVLLDAYFLEVFRFNGTRAEYSREFFNPEVTRGYPPIDVVVLGDSTAKSAFNPLAYHQLFSVNLALNGGTALTAYEMLDRYLRHHSKPKCILYLSQYNWQRNYSYFFERIVSYRSLDFTNIFDIWRRGVSEGVYPRTDYSTLGFFLASLRYSFFIGELPLNLIQRAVFKKLSGRQTRWQSLRRQMVRSRGFQDNELRRVQPEIHFFTPELHDAFLGPFLPYATEDYYLRELIERTGKLGITMLWANLPLAESENYVAAELYQRQRDLYVLGLMQNHSHVQQVPMPLKMPRKYYFDFTHFIPEGAEALQTYFVPSLRQYCAGDK